jgi:flagellar motor protein MotB
MSIARTPSTLHLQMGQEVMYLLLVTSLIANFVLATLAMRSSKEARELSGTRSYAETIQENRRLRSERATLHAKINELQFANDAANAVLKRAEEQIRGLANEKRALEEKNRQSEAAAKQTAARLNEAEEKIRQMEAREAERKQVNPQRPTPQDQPPIITLREADGFSFDPGSAAISDGFLNKLNEIVPRLASLSDRYGTQIVEVIGHTDGTSLRDTTRRRANLDASLGQFLDSAATTEFLPYDNVGLGISRAVSVARALRAAGLATKLDIQPLSAAHLISPKDRAEPAVGKINDASRRRIEIRIRRISSN